MINYNRDPRFIVISKASDEIVNNSNVLQDDDDLTINIQASSNYFFILGIFYDGAAIADLDIKWSVPVGCSVEWDAATGGTGWLETDEATLAASAVGTLDDYLIFGVIKNGVNSGSFKLQWAQHTADASNLTLHEGSTLILVRL